MPLTDAFSDWPRVRFFGLLIQSIILALINAGPTVVDSAKPRVCIVGGGVAGVVASFELSKKANKIDILLLEAADHLGGRAWTVNIPNSNVAVDMGAQWMHYSVGHPFYEAAKRLNIQTFAETAPYRYIKPSGVTFSNTEINTLYDDYNKIMRRVSYYQDSTSKDQPLSSAIQRAWSDVAKTLKMLKDTNLPSAKKLLAGMVMMEIESEYATVAKNMSLWWWDDDFGGKGPDRLTPIGLGGLLLQAFPIPKVQVKLSTRIKAIDSSHKGLIQLKSVDNEVFDCSAAIVTVSLGVMQSGYITFKPSLPLATRKALSHRGLGHSEKFILQFASQWWPSTIVGFMKIDADQLFREFYDHTYVVGKPILVAFLDADEHVAKLASFNDDQILEYILDDLQKMFPNLSVPRPIYYRAARWVSDPLYLGAWSYNAVGINPGVDFKNIKRSASSRLIFAGEHTDKKRFGTVWGAYSSGKAAAATIINVLNV